MNANLPARDTRDVIRVGVQYGARLFSMLAVLCAVAQAGCGELPDDIDGQASAATVPAQFTDGHVVAVSQPTDLAFTPDGRMLIATQSGKLLVYTNGSLRSTPALDLSSRVCTNSERGLLGVTIDPDFANNKFIYVFYTHKWGTCQNNVVDTSPQNRVSRFTYDLTTNTAGSELVILDRILSLGANHNGGDLAFGSDGLLYVTSGDSGCEIRDATACGGGNRNAMFTGNLSGKILRVDVRGVRPTDVPAYKIPSDNPFASASGSKLCANPELSPPIAELGNSKPCKEIFSYGLRNPFRFAFKPGTSKFFINDVGQNKYEEIDEGDQAAPGANYGWNTREGFCARDQICSPGTPPAGLTNPIYAYGRDAGCLSITGGAFVPDSVFGSSFEGAYLFADYGCGKISKLVKQNGVYVASDFVTNLGGSSATSLEFGPLVNGRRALYYTTYAGGGSVRRVDFTGPVNRAPMASFVANPETSLNLPVTVRFDASASRDDDQGDFINGYTWKFGDGTGSTTGPIVEHQYTTAAEFTVTLVVKDSRGLESSIFSKKIVTGNAAPVVTMDRPVVGETFIVGQDFTLRATATDREDGVLGADKLTWWVNRHHDSHTHPWLLPTQGNDLRVSGAPPEDLLAATNSFLEVWVRATDSRGVATEVRRDILPREVDLSFASQPPGVVFTLGNDSAQSVTTPATITSWQGWNLSVGAPADFIRNGQTWKFKSWEDSSTSRSRTISTTATSATYTATYTQGGFSARVNFQPAGSPVPVDYVADTGAQFGDRGNGLSYGWNATNNETRDRNASNSLDQRYDTLNHMQKPSNPNARWEIAVPNGTYKVRAVSGDPQHIDSVFRLNAESVQVLQGTPTDAQRWIEGTANVTVSDGRLTLTNGSGAANNKINFVEITPL